MSETCRVIINQVKQKLHLVGYLPIQYYKDARYHEHKMLNVIMCCCECEARYFLPEEEHEFQEDGTG